MKGELGAGEISQAQSTAEQVKATQDYIASLTKMQAGLDPTSDRFHKLQAEIEKARASLLQLGEGQKEFQEQLDATKAALAAGIITQAQADAENNAAITAQIARLRQLQTTVKQTSAAYQELETKINNLAAQQQQTTALGKITTTFRQVINEWGDLGKNASQWLSQSMTSGISTVSAGLTGLITKTGNWKQTFTSAIDSMLQGLIELGVKTVLHYALMGAMMLAHAALGNSTTASTVATQVAAGTAIAVAHAPAAAATSVSSYGVAAIVGAALAVAAIAAIIALLAGGFAEGGLIPGSPSHSDNRIARVATGEYVVRTAAVQHWGADVFEMLNSFQFPFSMPAFAAGGLVGGGAAAMMAGAANRERDRIVNEINVGGPKLSLFQLNSKAAIHEAMRSSDGDAIILESVHRQKHRMPFKR